MITVITGVRKLKQYVTNLKWNHIFLAKRASQKINYLQNVCHHGG